MKPWGAYIFYVLFEFWVGQPLENLKMLISLSDVSGLRNGRHADKAAKGGQQPHGLQITTSGHRFQDQAADSQEAKRGLL